MCEGTEDAAPLTAIPPHPFQGSLMKLGGRQREMCQEVLRLMRDAIPLERRKCPVGQKSALLDVGLTEFPGVEEKPGEKRVHDDIVDALPSKGDAMLMLGSAEVQVVCPEVVGVNGKFLTHTEESFERRISGLAKKRDHFPGPAGAKKLRQDVGQGRKARGGEIDRPETKELPRCFVHGCSVESGEPPPPLPETAEIPPAFRIEHVSGGREKSRGAEKRRHSPLTIIHTDPTQVGKRQNPGKPQKRGPVLGVAKTFQNTLIEKLFPDPAKRICIP